MKSLILTLTLSLASLVQAADDPSIKGKTREGVQAAMQHHIGQNTLEDRYVIFDGQTGKLNRLKFAKLHKGIVKKGDFYVSCADFLDGKGNKYDVDFLVAPKNDQFLVLQALVHSVNGNKRKYHLENN